MTFSAIIATSKPLITDSYITPIATTPVAAFIRIEAEIAPSKVEEEISLVNSRLSLYSSSSKEAEYNHSSIGNERRRFSEESDGEKPPQENLKAISGIDWKLRVTRRNVTGGRRKSKGISVPIGRRKMGSTGPCARRMKKLAREGLEMLRKRKRGRDRTRRGSRRPRRSGAAIMNGISVDSL